MTRTSLVASALVAVSLACGAPVAERVAVVEQGQGTCSTGHHECAAWGASCSGGTLETCVVGTDGCRKLLTEACALGCGAGACKTCEGLSAPERGSSLAQPTAFYRDAVRTGDVAIAAWSERNGPYTGPGGGFATVSLANPEAPATLTTQPLPAGDHVTALRSEGARLYGLVKGRLQVYDATNPSQITALGAYMPASAPTSLAVAGGVAYVGSAAGIDVVSVTTPTPTLLSVVATTTAATSLAVAGTRVAVTGSAGPNTDNVDIVDVSDPSAPSLLSTLALGAKGYSSSDMLAFDGQRVFVAGTYSYGSTLYQTVEALSVAADGTLARTGSLRSLAGIRGIALAGSELRLQLRGGLGVLDVSGPAPTWKKHVWVTDDAVGGGLLAGGGMAFTSGGAGITAVDLARAGDVTLLPVSGYDPLAGGVTKGSLAYLARPKSGLVIEDVRDPAHPIALSRTAMAATSIAMREHHVFLTVGDSELRIYDVSSPWAPRLVGTAAAPPTVRQGWLTELSLDGDRAYAKCDMGSICVFDVSNVAAPTLVTRSTAILQTVGSSSIASVMAMRGHHLFLPQPSKLTVVDLLDPAAPTKVAEVPLGGYSGGAAIAFVGDTAWIAYACHGVQGDQCFEAFDVTTPAAPVKVGGAVRPDGGRAGTGLGRLSTLGNLLMLQLAGGVVVLDVSDRTRPKALGELWTSLGSSGGFGIGRHLTVHSHGVPTSTDLPPRDQVIEICK